MNHNYIVTWHIELTAATPREAAQQAREIQLDPESTATVFEIAINVDVNED